MKIINKDILWLYEGMSLCSIKANPQKLNIKIDRSNRSIYFKNIEKATKKTLSKIKNSDELIYYFKEYNNHASLANILLYSYFDFCDLENLSIKDQWLKILIDAKNYHYTDDMVSGFGFELQANNGKDIWQWLDTHTIDDELRYKLLKAIFNPSKTVEVLYPLIIEAITIFKNEINEIDPNLLNFAQQLKKHQEEFKQYIKNHQIKWSDSVDVYPSLVNFQIVSYIGREYFDRSLTIFYGIGVDLKYALNYKIVDSAKQTNFLKALADPSKYEILKLLKNKPMYGQEIANKLKLKTPTVSYHMDVLLNLGIINVSKENNRIYFSLNTNAICEYLDEIKKDFI